MGSRKLIVYKYGNLFDSQKLILVNTVNCVGIMGKGIALEFKRRFPSEYFLDYQKKCQEKIIKPGSVDFYFYKNPFSNFLDETIRIIVNFPTKNHWKNPSQYEWIDSGLNDFVQKVKSVHFSNNIERGCAFPLLGCNNGGLDPKEVIPMMEEKLGNLDMEIEIWRLKND